MGGNLLFTLFAIPLVGAFFSLILPARAVRQFALAVSLVGVFLAVALYFAFDGSRSDEMQMLFEVPWIPQLGISFGFGIDGLSFPLVLLTKIMIPIAILGSWYEARHLKAFLVCFLFLDSAMTGTFLTTDLFLFYIFWEAMLIPMLLLIGVWGSDQRLFASMKFFLYTFAGSVLMLASILYLFTVHQGQFEVATANIASLGKAVLSPQVLFWGLSAQDLVFWGFTIAFLIKVPLFPFHTWLPDAHVQAPTGGSILLAAILLKMGTYGLLRFSIPFAPESFVRAVPVLAGLSLAGILYGAWVAYQQTDMKKLVAYSSVSHLGFVVLGICSLNVQGLTGAVLQTINHGISTGALFLLVGMLYERKHSRKFADFGGLAAVMPWFSVFLVFTACSSMAVPGLNGFVGEFLILFGVFKAHYVWGGLAVLGVIFGALYTLTMLKKVLWGPLSPANAGLKDLSARDWYGIIPLAILMVWLGIAPGFLLNKIQPSLENYFRRHLPAPSALAVEKTKAIVKGGAS